MKYLEKLDPQPDYYIFITNNVTDNTLKVLDAFNKKHPDTKIINFDFPTDIVSRLGSPYGPIAVVRQMLLNQVRKLSVDYAIFLDDDIFLADKDFITKIISNNKDIVGGAYFRTYPHGDILSYLTENDRKEESKSPYLMRNYQLHKLFKVVAVGGGCMCISNKVLMDKRVNFYPITEYYKDGTNAEDYAYCVLAGKLGYEVWVDDRFKVCHYQIHKARPWRVNDKGEYIPFEY
jgi:hypothetical protein